MKGFLLLLLSVLLFGGCAHQGKRVVRLCPEKLSPSLRAKKENEVVRAFVKFKKWGEEELRRKVKVLFIRGNLALVEAPLFKVLELSCEPWVIFVEEPRRMRKPLKR